MRHEPYRPILITDARQSQDDQLRSRKRRYTLMMAARVVCLILGGVLVAVDAPFLAVWLPLCAVGMVLIPWLAVLIANDRPPKDEHRLRSRFTPRRAEEVPPLALPAESAAHRVIDGEP